MAQREEFASLDRRELLKLLALVSPDVLGSRLSAEGSQTRSPSAGNQQPERTTPMRSLAGRPRLFCNTGTLRRLKQRFVSNPEEEDALRRRGEELLKADLYPESVAEVGGGQQANYITPANQIAEMGLTLGLLFHLTGEPRYADKLREALLYYTGYVRWFGPGLVDRVPPWHSELDTSRFSFGYAAGYDALRHMLSETDRGRIADGMVRLGALTILDDWILPGKRIHSLDSMGHNWWGVCVAGGGLCALALLGDDPRARAWTDAVVLRYCVTPASLKIGGA
jgi:oligo-alginate lyase